MRSMTIVILAACAALIGCGETPSLFQPTPAAVAPTPTPRPTPAPKAAASDKNPEYLAWSSFPVGSTCKISTLATAGTKSQLVVTTFVLKTVTAEKVIVVVQNESGSGEAVRRSAKQDVEILAKLAKPSSSKPLDADDVVVISGKSYNCLRSRYVVTEGNSRSECTAWTSKDVPGGIVKAAREDWVAGQKRYETQTHLESFSIGSGSIAPAAD